MPNPHCTPGPKTIPLTVAELMDIIWNIAARNRDHPICINDATTLRNIAPMIQPVILAAMPQIKAAFGVPVAEKVHDELEAGLNDAREFEDPLLANIKITPCVPLIPSHSSQGRGAGKLNTVNRIKPPAREPIDLSDMLPHVPRDT
jgi:hypothetical protein